MRAKLSGPATALLIATTIGCGAATTTREDALWRTYGTARPEPRHEPETLFAGHEQLQRAALVEGVLARNPSVGVAREALRAALAEIPRASALDDPMLGYELAPLSVTGEAPFGQVVSVRQKLPFPGKRQRVRDVALAMAEAEAADLGLVRLELAEMASALYDDYFVAARARDINAQHKLLLEQMKKSAEAQYVAGRAAQQDPIQAEVELAQLDRERIMLEAERDQIVARINGLLHRAPTSPLPPPPGELEVASSA